jgi:uncharacterized protein YdaU (DUF1376 family)
MTEQARPAFQFYPKEFLSSSKVMAMTLTERGAYITLLSVEWLDGSLPTSAAELARILGLSVARFQKLWRGLLASCFVERNGRLVNDRLERVRAELAAYIAAAKRGGTRSAEARRKQFGTAQPSKGGSAEGSKSLRRRSRSAPEVTSNPPSNPPLRELPRTSSNTASASATASATASTSDPSDQRGATPTPITEFLTFYEQKFTSVVGDKPLINGRDAKIAKTILDKYGPKKAQNLLNAFFATSDEFILKAGFGLNIFAGQLNKFLGDQRPRAAAAPTGGRTGAPPKGKYDGITEG